MDNFELMAKALAERNRQSRRLYTIMIPFAIAGLIGAFALRVMMRGSTHAPQQTTETRGRY